MFTMLPQRCLYGLVVVSLLAGCDQVRDQLDELSESATRLTETAAEELAEAASPTRATPVDEEVQGVLEEADMLMDISSGRDQRYDRYNVVASERMMLHVEVTSEEFDPNLTRPAERMLRPHRSPGPVHRTERLYTVSSDGSFPFDVLADRASQLGAYTLRYRTWDPPNQYILPLRRSPEHSTAMPLPPNATALEAGQVTGTIDENTGALYEPRRGYSPSTTVDDCSHQGLFRAYSFEATDAQSVRIEVRSSAFGPNLVLISPDGFELQNDSDSRRARIRHIVQGAGRYFVLVYGDDGLGDFELTLR